MKRFFFGLTMLMTTSFVALADKEESDQVALDRELLSIEFPSFQVVKPPREKAFHSQLEKFRDLSEAFKGKGENLKDSFQRLQESGGAMDGGGGQGIVILFGSDRRKLAR